MPKENAEVEDVLNMLMLGPKLTAVAAPMKFLAKVKCECGLPDCYPSRIAGFAKTFVDSMDKMAFDGLLSILKSRFEQTAPVAAASEPAPAAEPEAEPDDNDDDEIEDGDDDDDDAIETAPAAPPSDEGAIGTVTPPAPPAEKGKPADETPIIW